MTETNTLFEFNYASIILKPYTGDKGSSSQLLKGIINKLSESDFPANKRIIDRHEKRSTSTKRRLVIISNRFENGGLRCFGRIALIKNKAPLVWGGAEIIEEIEKESNKQFIEITNYVIHFNSNADPIIMFEYNHEGPRLSDIEYYLRQIGKEYKLAKNIHTSLHIKTDYERLDKSLKNVFGVTVKVNCANSVRFDWFKTLKTLNDDSGYKDVRLELFFKRTKSKNGQYEKNIRGIDFARNLISWLNKDKKNINYIDDLKMSYQVNDDDEIIDLDFLKNKVVSMLKIPRFDGKVIRPVDFNNIVGQEFNYYLNNGKVLSEEQKTLTHA